MTFFKNRRDRCGESTTTSKHLRLEWTESLSFEDEQKLLESISGKNASTSPNKRIHTTTERSENLDTLPRVIRAGRISLVEALINDANELPLVDHGIGLLAGRSHTGEHDYSDGDEEDEMEEEEEDDDHSTFSEWETFCNSFSSDMHRMVGTERSRMELLGDFDRELDTIEACLSSQDSDEVLDYHYDDKSPIEVIELKERQSGMEAWRYLVACMD